MMRGEMKKRFLYKVSSRENDQRSVYVLITYKVTVRLRWDDGLRVKTHTRALFTLFTDGFPAVVCVKKEVWSGEDVAGRPPSFHDKKNGRFSPYKVF